MADHRSRVRVPARHADRPLECWAPSDEPGMVWCRHAAPRVGWWWSVAMGGFLAVQALRIWPEHEVLLWWVTSGLVIGGGILDAVVKHRAQK